MNRRAPGGNQKQTESWKRIDRARSRTRARGGHPFRVLKQLWGFTKTRYRGIAKSLARAQTLFALANLYTVRKKLMPPGGDVRPVTETGSTAFSERPSGANGKARPTTTPPLPTA